MGYHIAQAAVTTYIAFDEHIGKPFGLRKVEFSLLMLLLANGPLTPRQLAGTLTLTAPTLTLLLDRLQARGLLRRERNPSDGRSQHIVLTARGPARGRRQRRRRRTDGTRAADAAVARRTRDADRTAVPADRLDAAALTR
jgi:predicted ArsR family transcriptional regulator